MHHVYMGQELVGYLILVPADHTPIDIVLIIISYMIVLIYTI